MGAINDKDIVQKQYKNATNLNTRISIHEKYSVNKQGYGNWIVSNYQITNGMRVFKKVIEQNTADGILKVPKEYGMFVCS